MWNKLTMEYVVSFLIFWVLESQVMSVCNKLVFFVAKFVEQKLDTWYLLLESCGISVC